MNDYAEVIVLAEGPTEQLFIKRLLAPYLAHQGVFLTPVILNKPGEKGGDVKFARARNDIEKHLKQRKNTWITLLVDYYGIGSDWPGYAESKKQTQHTRKAQDKFLTKPLFFGEFHHKPGCNFFLYPIRFHRFWREAHNQAIRGFNSVTNLLN